jgi:adenylate cyclase
MWAGSLPAKRVIWLLALVFSGWVLIDVMVLHVTNGIAQSSFDAMVRARIYAAAPDPRIVIVDIDEASLARMSKEFGRWPWSRDTLATALDFVEKQLPAAIVWDIIFSDADKLSPGGDAAFNEAVLRSKNSHFSVVRLLPTSDSVSELTHTQLPGLWSSNHTNKQVNSTVALIAPVLPAIAAAPLGFNNGYPDADGVLRRYRYIETLPDGSQIQSIAASVAGRILSKENNSENLPQYAAGDELIVWRKQAHAYPVVSFADLFASAEGEKPLKSVPSFAGKIVILGSTAPSLHDIHPTPISALQNGVESLATVIDNAINHHTITELPRWIQALVAIGLCLGLAFWAQNYHVDSLSMALLVLPLALLAIGYASLNGSPVFIDLHLSAALALMFLATLRLWNNWRQQYWRSVPKSNYEALSICPLHAEKPWVGAQLDRLIDVLEAHSATCRVIVSDTRVIWPAKLLWPELVKYVAVVGSDEAVQTVMPVILKKLDVFGALSSGQIKLLTSQPTKSEIGRLVMVAWGEMQITAQNSKLE